MSNVVQKVSGDDPGTNLAANCGQIFAKGPQITKDIVTKVKRADRVGSERRFFCGHEFRSRDVWVLSGLLILFSFSCFGSVLFWWTNFFDKITLQSLVLKNGTESFKSFIKPDVGPYIGVHIFNYTNVDEFQKGLADKLQVADIGPYVFQEHIERVNVVIDDDGSITFQEKRSYTFIPEKSNGRRQSDQFFVPNLPLLGTVSMAKDAYFVARMGLASILNGLNAKAFLKLPAQRFIWGYDDSLFSLVKSVVSFQQREMPFEKFGLLAPKSGTSKDRITVASGEDNIDDVGKIIRFNGEDRMSHWSTDDCNSIDGTQGALFGPYSIRAKKPVSIYQKDLCRKLTIQFKEEVTLMDTYKAYRYSPHVNSFAHPDFEPKNQCFCHLETGTCPPHGIINATPCAYGPAYLSFPHFLYGDEHLHKNVIGLEPNEEIHGSYMDIHPVLGYTMAGWNRFQLNMQVRTAYGIPQVAMFKDETMLPIAWFDSGIRAEDLPASVIDIFNLTSHTLPIIETILKYSCLLMSFFTFFTIFLTIQSRLRSRRPIRTLRPMGGMAPFQRNISGLDSLIN